MMSKIVVWDCSVVATSAGSTATNTSIASVVTSDSWMSKASSAVGNVVVTMPMLVEVAVLSGLVDVGGKVVIASSASAEIVVVVGAVAVVV